MISKFKFILILIFIPIILEAQSINSNLPTDSVTLKFNNIIEAQNITIFKLDSTIAHLKNENAHLKELAEQDIDHAKSLINSTETVVEFIAVLLAIFTVVGGFIIARMFRQSSQINKDHKVLLEDWENTRKEIEDLKESSLKEGKELLQILFYITEGDSHIDDRPEEAIRIYKEALRLRENNPEVYAKLGRAYLKLGEFKEAISYLEKGNKISPNNLSILNNLARVYRKIHNFDMAEKIHKQVLNIDENDIWSLMGLGHNYLVKKDFEHSEIYYKKAAQIDTSSISSYCCLAFLNACKNNIEKTYYHPEKALELLEHQISKSPESKWSRIWKAVFLVVLSKFDQANELFSKLKGENLSATQKIFIIDRLNVLFSVRRQEKIKKLISLFED